ncbi:MAG: glycosyltransferase [Gemmatimonadetes bacterium]|nr:glycosyltransferase [Gemmatimonadota bacterium]
MHSPDLRVVSFYGADVYLLGRDPAWVRNYRWVFERASRILSLGPAMSAGLEAIGCPAHKIVIHPLGSMPSPCATNHACAPPGRSPSHPLCRNVSRKRGALPHRGSEHPQIARRPAHPSRSWATPPGPGDQQTKDEIFALLAKVRTSTRCARSTSGPASRSSSTWVASHVFVVPSVTAEDGDAEGTPAVMGQMMATGMPTVATRHSDIPYTFGPYADRLVAERDSMALAERLQRYYDDPEAMTREGLDVRHPHLRGRPQLCLRHAVA